MTTGLAFNVSCSADLASRSCIQITHVATYSAEHVYVSGVRGRIVAFRELPCDQKEIFGKNPKIIVND